MAIDIYDLALLNKIKTVFANTVYMSEEHGNSYKQAVKSLGELKFPLVSIYRPDGYTRSSFNTTYQNLGRYIVTSSTGKALSFKALQVDLEYTMEVASRTRKALESLTGELMLFFTQRPNLELDLYLTKDKEKDGYITSKFPIMITGGPEDASYMEEEDTGTLYRYVIKLTIERAWLFNTSDKFGGELSNPDYSSDTTPIEVVEVNIYPVNNMDDELRSKPTISFTENPALVLPNEEIELADYISSEDEIDGDLSSQLKFYADSEVEFITPSKIKVGTSGEIRVIVESVNKDSIKTMEVFNIKIEEE